MISGDNELTVENVARDVGIKNAHAISLIGLKEENLKNEVENYNIFGRTSPEQKKIIVESLIEELLLEEDSKLSRCFPNVV